MFLAGEWRAMPSRASEMEAFMATSTAYSAIGAFALLAVLAACSPTPTPRGYADQGVPYVADRTSHNAPYYIGGDPAFRATGKSGGGAGD